MNNEDFERLKAVCEKEGFTIDKPWESGLTVVKKKDIWEGVEYGFCTKEGHCQFEKGVIYRRVKGTSIDHVDCFYHKDAKGSFFGDRGGTRGAFKPSTEYDYIAQLKKEACRKFGSIKEGDRFDFTNVGYPNQPNEKIHGVSGGYVYEKEFDRLIFSGWEIYKSGKWASKVPKKIEVIVGFGSYNDKGEGILIRPQFTIKNIDRFDYDALNCRLGEFIENYLNKVNEK